MTSFQNFTCTTILGTDPELRHTSGGTAVCKFRVPISYGYGDKAGSWWATVEIWGKRGQTVADHFKKKDPICLSGTLAQDKWNDKNTGEERTALVLKCENWGFVPKQQDDGPAKTFDAPAHATQGSADFLDADDGVPF